MPEQSMTANLYMKEGSSDKVYNLSLVPFAEGWMVNVTRGRRGSTLIIDKKTQAPVDYDKAAAIFTKTMNEKLGKGYKRSDNTVLAPAYVAPKEREQTSLVAMLLNEVPEDDLELYIPGNNWFVQQKIDGRRMIIQSLDGVVIAANRRGQMCGIPEDIENDVKALGYNVVLDGEAVGEIFHVFDILQFEGVDIRQLPYARRLQYLDKLGLSTYDHQPTSPLCRVATATTEEEKRNLFESSKKEGCEGIVFKLKTASYSSGRPASGGDALKFKFVKTLTAIVTGVNTKRSVSLGLLDDSGELVDVGNVTVPANQPIPEKGEMVEIRYLYANRGGSLYQPYLIGIRDDIPMQDCGMRQVKYKAEAEEADITPRM